MMIPRSLANCNRIITYCRRVCEFTLYYLCISIKIFSRRTTLRHHSRIYYINWMKMVTLWIVLCVIMPWTIAQSSYVDDVIQSRLESLKIIARKGEVSKPTCSADKFIYISEFPWGNSGNHLISLTHGLWLSRKLDATFIVPNWIEPSLHHFDLSVLSEMYCFTMNPNVPTGKQNYAVTSEESFFMFKLFRDTNLPYIPLLPPLDSSTILDISKHYVKVYAALWSSPEPNIIAAAKWILNNYLDSNTEYVSVHKRNLDGGCGKIMKENTKPSDFSSKELAMDSPEWLGDLGHHHPLCEMPLEFVNRTIALNNYSHRKMFVAFDGQGDVTNFKRHKAVFSSVMEAHPDFSKIPMKYVDMFVSMLGDFFIQNPRSTFSWQIYVIRVCFGLHSVPTIPSNDIFLQRVPQDLIAANRPLWVSWTSLQTAFSALMSS